MLCVGNLDVEHLERFIQEKGAENVAFIVLTVTSNLLGAQPVSLENMRQVRALADRHQIPINLDAARFAENAYFIKQREPGCENLTIEEISRKMFALADYATVTHAFLCWILFRIHKFISSR